MGARLSGLVILATFALPGCALGIPPMTRLEVGAGAQSAASGDLHGLGEARISVHPLQIPHATFARRFDAGLGYGVEAPVGGALPAVRSAFTEVSFFPVVSRSGSDSLSRLGVSIAPSVVLRAGETGVGARVVTTYEWSSFAHVVSSEKCGEREDPKTRDRSPVAAGGAYGELAAGFYVAGEYAAVGSTSIWTSTAGLSVRLPAAGFFADKHGCRGTPSFTETTYP